MRNDSRFLPLLRRALLPLFVLGATACADDNPLQPGTDGVGNRPAPGSRALGVMEITISGIGTSTMSASALPVRPGAELAGGAPGLSLDLIPPAGSSVGGIQIEPYSTGSFTRGARGEGGVRYLFATFRVRNADQDGNAYTTARTNLTFVAASTGSTINGTAISSLRRFDGARAADAIAPQVIPTGAVAQAPGGEIFSTGPDVLQVFEESELTGITVPAGVELFPYGFMVRHETSAATRTLAPDPAPGDFEGMVTFAFKLPLQATAAEDPFMVSATFLAVDDDETRVTQSLEEQTPAGMAAFLASAEALGATMKTVLPGPGAYWGESTDTRTVCTVRTAGPSEAPVRYLVHAPVASVSFPSAGPFATRPLWAGGSVARGLDFAALDGGGTWLPDVPAHLIFSQAGVLTTWGRGGVRMLPRRDRANTLVSATACGHMTSTQQVLTSGFSPLAGGGGYSLALKADGTVVGWGNNGDGQTNMPAELTDVVQVAGGRAHSLALKADGTVVAWGSNLNGQSNVPVGLANVVQIAAGFYHSLALKADGTLVAWGYNYHGQATVPARLTDVVQVAAGWYHSLALTADGTVAAWGWDSLGLTDVPAELTDVVQIAAGGEHSLALKADGTVVAWGNNRYGESSVPPGLADVVQVAGGDAHSLALKADGTVVAWGLDVGRQTSVPPGLTDVVQVAAGHYHSLALKADGTVVGWGRNAYGEINVPVPLVAAVP
jgi:alpha-tubulin suppressor-like RCC1 family protein